MHRLLLHCVVVIAIAGLVRSSDDGCQDMDARIEQEFVQPLQRGLKQKSQDYVSLQDRDYVYFGYGAKFYDGNIGDLSRIHLQAIPGHEAAAVKCTVGNVKTLTVDAEFEDIHLSFKEFGIYLPFITIGDVATVFTIKGVRLSTNSATVGSNQCTSSSRTYLDDDASLEISFQGGVVNGIVQYVLNHYINPYVLQAAKSYSIDQKLLDILSQAVNPYLTSNAAICENLSEE